MSTGNNKNVYYPFRASAKKTSGLICFNSNEVIFFVEDSAVLLHACPHFFSTSYEPAMNF